jgi:hypothetical protein
MNIMPTTMYTIEISIIAGMLAIAILRNSTTRSPMDISMPVTVTLSLKVPPCPFEQVG